MIDDVAAEQCGEVALGDRHADGVGEPLAERAGGGFDAGRVAVFGMAGRERAELAEALDLVDRHLLVAEQIKQRVEQHRAVAGREHEAVAVGPGRIGRIELQKAREQHGRDIGRAHRQAGMSGLRLLDRIHRQRADGVGHAVVIGARRPDSCAAAGKREAWARFFALAARRRSGIVMGRPMRGASRRTAAVTGTGGAQITWEALESIARRRAGRVMHRRDDQPLRVDAFPRYDVSFPRKRLPSHDFHRVPVRWPQRMAA